MPNILIVDDEEAIKTSLCFALEDKFRVFTAASGDATISCLREEDIDLVLLDLRLGNEDGQALLKKIKNINEQTIVIMMTAYGTIKSSVDAIRAGAFYYVTKPINMDELNVIISTALEFLGMRKKVQYLNQKLTQSYELSAMIGKSDSMLQILRDIERISNVESSVLITGESGTGKELVAKAIHAGSRRKNDPFEVINCAAIPVELLESELFGHEKGAFTGATQKKKGIFELAHGGTLFLDEVAEIDFKVQAKLLRAVQEKEIMPLGSGQRKKVDVRIISATNRDLKKMLDSGTFREDLYFRLNVVSVFTPPLRDRKEDIPLLINYFFEKYNREMGRQVRSIEPEALETLMKYHFKGNVRELENIIERAMVFSDGELLHLSSLPAEVRLIDQQKPLTIDNGMIPIRVGEDLPSAEEKIIRATLKYFDGDKGATARALKISERKLWYKIKEYSQRDLEASANFA